MLADTKLLYIKKGYLGFNFIWKTLKKYPPVARPEKRSSRRPLDSSGASMVRSSVIRRLVFIRNYNDGCPRFNFKTWETSVSIVFRLSSITQPPTITSATAAVCGPLSAPPSSEPRSLRIAPELGNKNHQAGTQQE